MTNPVDGARGWLEGWHDVSTELSPDTYRRLTFEALEHLRQLLQVHDALVAYVRASTVGSDNVKRMAEAYQAIPDWVKEELDD